MIVEFDLLIQGDKVSYPFHFGMSAVRAFSQKKNWQSDSLIKLTDRFFGGTSSFNDQTEFMMYSVKAGLAYTNSKLPVPPESDVVDQYYIVYPAFQKAFEANLVLYAKNAGIEIKEGAKAEGAEELGKS